MQPLSFHPASLTHNPLIDTTQTEVSPLCGGECDLQPKPCLIAYLGWTCSWAEGPAFHVWGVRLAAQDTALSRRRPRVRIPYALPHMTSAFALCASIRPRSHRAGWGHFGAEPFRNSDERWLGTCHSFLPPAPADLRKQPPHAHANALPQGRAFGRIWRLLRQSLGT